VVAGLVGLGCLLTLQGFAGGWPHEEGEGPIDRMGLGWLMFGLFCNVVLIDGVTFGAITLMPACGFIIASTVLFTCTARAFGSTRLLRDCCIGLLIATIAYVLFDRVLGYKIGSGFIERLL
jgi:putative tricarboxylic transport membrane protein